MIMSAPPSTAQPTISSNMPRTSAWRAVSSGVPDVGVRDVAGHEVAGSLVGDLPGDLECGAVQRLDQVLLADDPHLLAVTVVGERLDDVGAGALEVDVQGPQGVRVLQGDLGDERHRR